MKVRAAKFSDYPTLKGFDVFLGDRRIDMQRGEIFVCDLSEALPAGYMRITCDSFFDWPLLVGLCVMSEHRRCGIGEELVRFGVEQANLPRLYTSTEQGNSEMRGLLDKVGASQIGFADDLNLDGERELLYRLK